MVNADEDDVDFGESSEGGCHDDHLDDENVDDDDEDEEEEVDVDDDDDDDPKIPKKTEIFEGKVV